MKILSIDTSTRNLSLAVSHGEDILAYRNFGLGRMMSNSIMPKIHRLLKDINLSLEQIDGFAVGLGPGSFTSLRIGLATVKGLAFVSNKPVIGMSSLDAIALGVKESDIPICVVCDAKRSLVYACCYKIGKKGLKKLTKYRLTDIHQFLHEIKETCLFVGDGVIVYKEEIGRSKKAQVIIENERLYRPQAQYFIPYAYSKFKLKKHDNISTLAPMYLYKEDCQVRR